QAPRQRPAREALLPAGSRRQGRAHRREGLGPTALGRLCGDALPGPLLLGAVAWAGWPAPRAAPVAAAWAAAAGDRRVPGGRGAATAFHGGAGGTALGRDRRAAQWRAGAARL